MMHRTLSLGFAALFVVLAASGIGPRAARAASGPAALHGGAWSVELDKDMGNSVLAENEISLKRMSSATTGFRLSIGISYNGGSGFGTETDVPPATPVVIGQSSFNHNYTLRLDWVRHFALASNFDGQFGIGPVVDLYGYQYSNSDDTGYQSAASYRQNSYGGELNLGAEWFFTDRFSLGGRVGLIAMTGKVRSHQRFLSGFSGYDDTVEYTQNRIEGDPARIILTAHL
jgi:hypothetical protein